MIQRYHLSIDAKHETLTATEASRGEWCRWRDVQDTIQQLLDEIKKAKRSENPRNDIDKRAIVS